MNVIPPPLPPVTVTPPVGTAPPEPACPPEPASPPKPPFPPLPPSLPDGTTHRRATQTRPGSQPPPSVQYAPSEPTGNGMAMSPSQPIQRYSRAPAPRTKPALFMHPTVHRRHQGMPTTPENEETLLCPQSPAPAPQQRNHDQ